LAEQHRPDADVWTAPQADIDTIYDNEYWMPECDKLPLGVDFQFFSMKVNAGPHRAICILQESVGVFADGRIGPVTRQAVANMRAANIVQSFYVKSQSFYIGLHQPKFLNGWLNRAAADKALALLMLEGK
jgi:lysozyme family protein